MCVKDHSRKNQLLPTLERNFSKRLVDPLFLFRIVEDPISLSDF